MSYQESFPTANIKPKAHFLRHYPDMIRQFDPLVKTLRFESKHQYLKSFSQMTKNRKNVCQLSAKRYQFIMYLHYSKEYFLDHKSIHSFNFKETSCKALNYFDKNAVDDQLDFRTYDLLTQGSGVLFEGQRDLVGDDVVLNFCDEYQFGLVKSVLACREHFFFGLCYINY